MIVPRGFLLALAVCLLGTSASSTAFAHHGWSWAEGEQMKLTGTVETISMAPPHPMLKVRDAQGVVWQVDLGNPNQTARSGFTGESAKVGGAIVVIGNRALDRNDVHMKAVRVVIDGNNFDMYPERIKEN